MRITIAGLGLLGGSLGMALRRETSTFEVTGLSRTERNADAAVRYGAVDRAFADPAPAMRDADLLVLCVPIPAVERIARLCLAHGREGLVVTDVSSVKAAVVGPLAAICADHGAEFVGAHPMAGAETSGLEAARADLFDGATTILTPVECTASAALRVVEALWSAAGARCVRMSPDRHDAAVARTSHLVHLVASALAVSAIGDRGDGDRRDACGGGIRDTVRVAAADPEMWTEICRANRDHVRAAIDELMAAIRAFAADLDEVEPTALRGRFAGGRDAALRIRSRTGAPPPAAGETGS